jgi:hypothetical protein
MDYAQLVSALFSAAKSRRGGWLKRPGPRLKAAAQDGFAGDLPSRRRYLPGVVPVPR